MRLKQAIVEADKIRPNNISEEQKAAWAYELDERFYSFSGRRVREDAGNPWPEDYELRVPAAHANVYVLYLCAMIDNAQMEVDLYQNDMTMFNAAYSEMMAWWRRNNTPETVRREVGL